MRFAKWYKQPKLLYSVLSISLLSQALAAQDGPTRRLQPGTLQSDASVGPSDSAAAPNQEQKRIFGIIPNNRTSPTIHPYVAISAVDKFKIARDDAFDRGTFVLAAAFAGESQLTRNEPSFGTGAQAYGRYFICSYADYAIGDFMTEGLFPTMLHQDPRYFRKGEGGMLSRIGYAVGQLFSTVADNGGRTFNSSEVFGNATSVAISQAYYPNTRDAKDAGVSLATQLGVDGASNILKEFSPDIYRFFSKKRHHSNP